MLIPRFLLPNYIQANPLISKSSSKSSQHRMFCHTKTAEMFTGQTTWEILKFKIRSAILFSSRVGMCDKLMLKPTTMHYLCRLLLVLFKYSGYQKMAFIFWFIRWFGKLSTQANWDLLIGESILVSFWKNTLCHSLNKG